VLANAEQHPPHLAVGYFQPFRCSYLRKMLLLYLVQHFQSVPFSNRKLASRVEQKILARLRF
jgi:hypothetical protein